MAIVNTRWYLKKVIRCRAPRLLYDGNLGDPCGRAARKLVPAVTIMLTLRRLVRVAPENFEQIIILESKINHTCMQAIKNITEELHGDAKYAVVDFIVYSFSDEGQVGRDSGVNSGHLVFHASQRTRTHHPDEGVSVVNQWTTTVPLQ